VFLARQVTVQSGHFRLIKDCPLQGKSIRDCYVL